MINKVCVIGAGTMGSGIAAQVANAGISVLMLDMAGKGEARNQVCANALERIAKSDPLLLMDKANIDLIEIGNIEDDLARVGECDWVVEAIVERLDIKRELYRDLLPHLKPEALVSSNTSTIPIKLLMEGMPDGLASQFCITHFFNPVRYMRLLELVAGEKTSPDVMRSLGEFCDVKLGKGIVECRDTPGFLGNRVGVFAMQAAIHEASNLGLDIEDADALFGRAMGIPKTGAFGLYDLIGIDLMADVVRSLRSILPPDDAFHEVGSENELINNLVENGYTGNKGKGGFYCQHEGENLAIDLNSELWRPRKNVDNGLAQQGEKHGLKALIEYDHFQSQFCWNVMRRIITYSASLLPHVTHSPQDIDDAMKLGYNWVKGPFEMLDELGADNFVARLERENIEVPEFLGQCGDSKIYQINDGELSVRNWDVGYRSIKLPDGVMRFHLLRQTLTPIIENDSASLFHLEGGERLVEFHTKANALDADCMAIIQNAADDPGPGIIVHNDAQHFSAGVNLGNFLDMIDAQNWQGIDGFLMGFQSAVAALCYCDAPVIGAPSGLAIGGGYEVLAHCDKVVAHANSVMGLVEPVVGLVPGGGGVKETYWRWYQRTGNWEKAAWNTFNQIGYGKTGSSPHYSQKLAYFDTERDVEVMNRDRLLQMSMDALAQMHDGYSPRLKPEFELAGKPVYDAMVDFLQKGLDAKTFTEHDVTVVSAVAAIVTGGPNGKNLLASEEDLFRFERENFIQLAKTPQTRARIAAMLGR